MFLHRLAGGLVFLAGVGLSRLGVGMENWPILALGLIASTLGLWHFLMAGTAADAVRRGASLDGPSVPVPPLAPDQAAAPAPPGSDLTTR